ncbi:CLUMA_CG007095, isoform A [Clunio marinus]|uniref:CLUMA_CG007095, isoform A n=1 Tax=Clunio marinus TaxID=568069 RepID=A0A1J1I1C7_9DIPT|nr:CLUMA_CG007095, isoform A [Clunio marinus]
MALKNSYEDKKISLILSSLQILFHIQLKPDNKLAGTFVEREAGLLNDINLLIVVKCFQIKLLKFQFNFPERHKRQFLKKKPKGVPM